MMLNNKNNTENVTLLTPHVIEVSSNSIEKNNLIQLYDLIPPVLNTHRYSYEITEQVFQKYQLDFDSSESKLISLNHFELFELTYHVVQNTINNIQQVKYNSVDELFEFNANTLPLFLEPHDISDEEMKWVNEVMATSNSSIEKEIEIKIPENAERNYYINVKRVLKANNLNPDFNETMLNFYTRTRE
jgi:hypothetical protein